MHGLHAVESLIQSSQEPYESRETMPVYYVRIHYNDVFDI